jgi:hypothetical protein
MHRHTVTWFNDGNYEVGVTKDQVEDDEPPPPYVGSMILGTLR